MKRFSASLVAAALVAFAVTGLHHAKQNDTAQPPTLTKDEWRQDLRYFAEQLAKRHKNLYHAVSKEQFASAVADLDAAIPTLQDHEIIVRLHQIAALVGDGHTGVHLPAYFKRYPLALFWFGDELRVIATSADYEKARGARVVKIGAFDIDEVRVRVDRCFPSADNENTWYELATSPACSGVSMTTPLSRARYRARSTWRALFVSADVTFGPYDPGHGHATSLGPSSP